jgi:hypothetical protein
MRRASACIASDQALQRPAETGHQRLVGPLVRADRLHPEVEALLQVGRAVRVECLPADGVEAALQRPAVYVPALLDDLRQREEALPGVEGRAAQRVGHAVADDRQEAAVAQRGVDLARAVPQPASRAGRAAARASRHLRAGCRLGCASAAQGRTRRFFTNSVV